MFARLVLAASLGLAASATVPAAVLAAAKPTAQATHCAEQATRQNLTGAARASFVKTCQKGPLTPKTPTGPVAANKESQAITKPSGVDRTTRAKQCGAEADRRHLTDAKRRAFSLSCLATAGPVGEGEAGSTQPQPGKAIKGIGENNYKPSATTAKSTPEHAPPAAAKPQN